MAVLTVTVKDERLREMDDLAKKAERTREELIDDAIDKYLREARGSEAEKGSRAQADKKRDEAFERVMNFRRVKLPADFDYKKELMEAIDERFNRL
jgi:predicted transcriptional regulator